MTDLTAIRQALADATPGPWEWADGGSFGGWWLSHAGDPAEPTIAATMGQDIRTRPNPGHYANMALIASAPSWLAELCDAVAAGLRAHDRARRAEALVTRLRTENRQLSLPSFPVAARVYDKSTHTHHMTAEAWDAMHTPLHEVEASRMELLERCECAEEALRQVVALIPEQQTWLSDAAAVKRARAVLSANTET